ncbi:MAG: gamma-glutamyl-gamma-aminobutyrate hydrolase family protein, partial [Planctomycetes bacterium]|nr:gamma-glutamyl-gamma-aminobutyrate hydrolase family protein [Planctomycetota bacterium]
MDSKPLIGLNADLKTARDHSPAFSYLCAGYYEAISKAGGIPLVVPPLEDGMDLDQVLNLFDGFVIIGGADLDPRRDGFMRHPSVRLLDRQREDFDRALISAISRRKLPVLG